MCPVGETPVAIRRSQAIPVLHRLGCAGGPTDEHALSVGPRAQPRVHLSTVTCLVNRDVRASDSTGSSRSSCFRYLWSHSSHSELLTIYLDVIIVCDIIKENSALVVSFVICSALFARYLFQNGVMFGHEALKRNFTDLWLLINATGLCRS